MKKLIAIGIILGLLVVAIPGSVGAWDTSQGCCQYTGCCRDLCCEEMRAWYRVSYLERVETGLFTPWGTPMTTGVLRQVYVEARDSKAAAESLGLRAGFTCWVVRVLDYTG